MTAIDLRPTIDNVVFPVLQAVLIPLVAGFVVLALRRLATLLHIKVTDQAAQVVENAIQNGTQLALNRAQTLADNHAIVTTKSDVIATAVNYALPKIQAEMKTAGVTPESIAERVEARLPASVVAAIPAQAPGSIFTAAAAVPPAPFTMINTGTITP